MNKLTSKLSFGEKIGYGTGDFASNLFWQTFMYFLPIFYTDVFGLEATVIAGLFGFSRIFDAFFDPLTGMIADRTKSRWGKFRPYILWGAVPFGIFGVLCFTTPDFSMKMKIIYAYVTYNLMMLVYTIVNIPYSSLMGVISADSQERTSVSSIRFLFAFGAGLFVTAFNNTFVEFFGKGDNVQGYRYTIMLYSAIAVVFFLITTFSTKERVQPIKKENNKVWSDLKDLLTNVQWIILLLAGIMTIFYVAVRNGAIAYYFKYYVTQQKFDFDLFGMHINYDIASSFMVLGTIASIMGTLFVKTMSDIIGKKKSYIILMLLSSIFTSAVYFLNSEQIGLMFTMQLLACLFMGPTSVLVWAMYADIADYSEWKTGRRATGLIFSASTMAQKFGWSIAGIVTMLLLAAFGYKSNIQQTPESLYGIRLLISFIPAIGSIACAVIVIFYGLDDKLMKTIQKELETRKT